MSEYSPHLRLFTSVVSIKWDKFYHRKVHNCVITRNERRSFVVGNQLKIRGKILENKVPNLDDSQLTPLWTDPWNNKKQNILMCRLFIVLIPTTCPLYHLLEFLFLQQQLRWNLRSSWNIRKSYLSDETLSYYCVKKSVVSFLFTCVTRYPWGMHKLLCLLLHRKELR